MVHHFFLREEGGGGGEEGLDKYMSYLETYIYTLSCNLSVLFLFPILSFITHLSNKVY